MDAIKKLCLVCMLLLITTYGCAVGKRHVTLNPVRTNLAFDASGQRVFIEVKDKRDSSLGPVVGHIIDPQTGLKGIAVIADKDVSSWVRDNIAKELRRFGASVTVNEDDIDNKTSRITVDGLSCYSVFFLKYRSVIKILVSVSKNQKIIQREYTGEATLGTTWTAKAASFQRVLELAMEDLLQKLMPDIITLTKN